MNINKRGLTGKVKEKNNNTYTISRVYFSSHNRSERSEVYDTLFNEPSQTI